MKEQINNIIIKESRLYILLGIIVCFLFTFPLFGYVKIFGQPIFERFYDLNIKEIIIFGSTSFFAGLVFIILCLSILFMLIKLFIPAKIIINKKGFTYGFKQNFIEWNEITYIKNLSIKDYGKKIVYLYLCIIPMLGFNGILQACRLFLLLQTELDGIITVKLNNGKIIILPIDDSFVASEEKVINKLNNYKKCK